ncbi:PEP-CTERM sorting domain-containing protein [Rubritalea sp.]|uniref:PEP-CTERM sorting domain-containing protein n=1 Tax=Rubritalea sp. TaxID=2109375 RepID=UPI003EF14C79
MKVFRGVCLSDEGKGSELLKGRENEFDSIKKKRSVFIRLVVDYWHLITRSYWGVLVLPLIVVVLEFFTNACGGVFFSPVSRVEQLVLILLMLGLAGLHFYWIRHSERATRLMAIVRGCGIAMSSYWCLLLLPVQAFGIAGYGMGVFFSFGIALLALPIFLLCFALASAPFGLMAGFVRRGGVVYDKKSIWVGALLGVLMLILVEGPSYVTRVAAKHGNVAVIRQFGDAEMLVDMEYECSWGSGVDLDTSGAVLGLFESGDIISHNRNSGDLDLGRLYFQVTGDVMSEQAAEGRQLGGFRSRSNFIVDENLGGDGVVQMVPDLDLKSARYDCHIDAASGLSYWESTYEFKNTGMVPKEARMQLLLPPSGVVSRLTLWVNGEPREAAFAATKKVAAAYKFVAVVQRRDPVLVRWVGPDRVLVQCFPVPAGGEMKIRVGVTSSFVENGRVYVPRIIEKNFRVKEAVDASLWIQGDATMQMHGLLAHSSSGEWREVHGSISMRELMQAHAFVEVLGAPEHEKVWTLDPFAKGDDNVLVRHNKSIDGVSYGSVVFVIDGSAGVAEWKGELEELIRESEDLGVCLAIVIAHSEKVQVLKGVDEFDSITFKGGQDNMAALLKGYELAGALGAEAIIWCHGAQPVRFESENALMQYMDYGLHQPDIITVDLVGGPNRVLETLGETRQIQSQVRPSLDAGISIESLLGKGQSLYQWSLQAEQPLEGGVNQVWDQLARWKAWDDVRYAKSSDEVIERAARYQLVTPVSGAVVLEAELQYKQHGLQPIDPNTAPNIPNIPEPSTSFLVFSGGLFLLSRRRRVSALT